MAKRARNLWSSGALRMTKLRDPSASAIECAAQKARSDLATSQPLQSAKRPAGRVMVAIMIAMTIVTLLTAFGLTGFEMAWVSTSILFGLMGLLRVGACLVPSQTPFACDDAPLPQATPIWTILIALYDEADSVPSLLHALSQLKWAPSRLDIIFACEADDIKTLQVLVAHQSKFGFRIVRVGSGGPRTKPHALATALPFARGRFLTVYDAEDRPDPQQLRAAFQAFLTGPPNLAVVQAPLVTWNHAESWIARQFALDYAIWFRVMLPAFASFSGFIPLGGTSNHFRTQVLRDVGGWDPYNVTEDADLGVRLSRNGHQTKLITPPTFEEAPPKVAAWVKQRGRWIQGHILTFSLHLRAPQRLVKDLGWRELFAFLVGLGIGPMSAIIFVPFTVGLLLTKEPIVSQFALTWFALGMLGQVIAAIVACYRDGRLALLRCIVTLPIYYALQSVAACRAMWRVVFTPSIWDKTDHGCAARGANVEGEKTWIGQQQLVS